MRLTQMETKERAIRFLASANKLVWKNCSEEKGEKWVYSLLVTAEGQRDVRSYTLTPWSHSKVE
jgi:hypothetical protein